MTRWGPLLVALTGAALIVLELRRPRDAGPSAFWLSVGVLALGLGVIGHLQRNQKPPEPPLPKL